MTIRDLLPVTPSLLPSNQNSSRTLSTSMTSPVKSGNSSETLGRNSNTARTTDPASISQNLQSVQGNTEGDMRRWFLHGSNLRQTQTKCPAVWSVPESFPLRNVFYPDKLALLKDPAHANEQMLHTVCETTLAQEGSREREKPLMKKGEKKQERKREKEALWEGRTFFCPLLHFSRLCFAKRTQDRVVVGGQKYLLAHIFLKSSHFVFIHILICDHIFKTVLWFKTTVSLLKLVIQNIFFNLVCFLNATSSSCHFKFIFPCKKWPEYDLKRKKLTLKWSYITLYSLFLCTAPLGVDWLQVGTMVVKETGTERRWLCFATVNGLSVTETSDTEWGDRRGSGPVSCHSLCRELVFSWTWTPGAAGATAKNRVLVNKGGWCGMFSETFALQWNLRGGVNWWKATKRRPGGGLETAQQAAATRHGLNDSRDAVSRSSLCAVLVLLMRWNQIRGFLCSFW